MFLIEARPVPTPADAERLVADLWQLSAGRAMGLFSLGTSSRVMLGICSPHRGLEETGAATIADHCGSSVEVGWTVAEAVDAAREAAAVHVLPTDRHLALESRTYGWQRTDPLRATFLALAHTPERTVAAVALGLRALPDLGFAMSVGVFAAGSGTDELVARVASSLGGVGVRLRRPMLQRRATRRMAAGLLHRPVSVHRAEVVSLFWHPPYGATLDVLSTDPAAERPGHLLFGGDP